MPSVLFHTPMIDGTRVVVSELAKQPLEAIEHFLSIEPSSMNDRYGCGVKPRQSRTGCGGYFGNVGS